MSGDSWSVKVICWTFGSASTDSPRRLSWVHGDHGVKIVRFRMDPGSVLELDPATDGAGKNFYMIFGKGD